MSEESKELLEMRLTAIEYAAKNINLYEFRPLNGEILPDGRAGAHIGLHLPNGLVRQYSLFKAVENPQSYNIGIKLDANSRGGSVFVHDKIRVGDVISVEPPRNNFPLVENAAQSVFFAGGIGITPIFSMIERLEFLAKDWTLYYACRSRGEAAFFNRLRQFPQVRFHFDDESGGFFDLSEPLAAVPANAHLYCCGPSGMLKAFESLTRDFAPEQVHAEYFTSKYEAAADGGFTVALARDGREFYVPAGKTILRILLENGIDVPFSCEEGVCGSCETRLISGVPDHRDAILSNAEKLENKTMLVCCSGAKSEKLILDL